jgi:hypothetical protein
VSLDGDFDGDSKGEFAAFHVPLQMTSFIDQNSNLLLDIIHELLQMTRARSPRKNISDLIGLPKSIITWVPTAGDRFGIPKLTKRSIVLTPKEVSSR